MSYLVEARYKLELVPPNNPSDYEKFYNKHEKLFAFTKDVSLTSHRLIDGSNTLTGFERNYAFAKFMLEKDARFKIMFHITCFDLNRINIETRLKLLDDLGIRQVLLITGDGYKRPAATATKSIWFKNSKDIISFLVNDKNKCIADYVHGVAIAAYPATKDRDQECKRIIKKIQSFEKINAIYSQCILCGSEYLFMLEALKRYEKLRNLHFIPSIAIYKDLQSLNKVKKFVNMSEDIYYELKERCLRQQTDHLGGNTRDSPTIVELYHMVYGFFIFSLTPGVPINVCLFGNVDSAHTVMQLTPHYPKLKHLPH